MPSPPPSTPAASHASADPPSPWDRLRALLTWPFARAATALYEADMASLARAAAATAGEMGRSGVTIDDLALVCLRERAAARVLARFDVDAIVLAGDLDQALSAADADDVTGAMPGRATHAADERDDAAQHEATRTDDAWQHVWDEAIGRRGAFTASVDELDLLLSCLLQPTSTARAALVATGVSLRRFALAVAHPRATVDDVPALHDVTECAVLVWNDAFTPLHRASAIVSAALDVGDVDGDVDGDRALALASEAGHVGFAVIFRGPTADARRLLAALEERAIDEASALYAELAPVADVLKRRGG